MTLKATKDTNSIFLGWTGACNKTLTTCIVIVDGTKTATATFRLKQFALKVTLSGNKGGTVTSDIAGINCGTDCVENYFHGTVVTLTPIANEGSEFLRWSGACTGNAPTCVVTMTKFKSVTAKFQLIKRHAQLFFLKR